MKLDDYKDLFPHATVRKEQELAIDFALRSFLDEGKRFVILEMGTGCGKSAIGLTIARYITKHKQCTDETTPGAFFVTTQKILQDQYEHDFSATMCSVKSSSNYTCSYYAKNTCAESRTLLKAEPKDSKFFRSCSFGCVYKQAKERFLRSQESVTNFPYFLAESNYRGEIKRRQLLVVDEAHNTDGELGKFVEISVSERFAHQLFRLDMPNVTTDHQGFTWVKEQYHPKLLDHVNHIKKTLEKYQGVADKLKDFVRLQKQIDMLISHESKIKNFLTIYDPSNWVMNVTSDQSHVRRLEFKAIDMSPFSNEYLFHLGDKVLMMSATILDKSMFCQTLGISDSDAAYLSLPSPFPVQNRPIMCMPVGKMTQNEIDGSLPKIAEAVKEILAHHKNEKGIIHTHTFKIANFIKNALNDPRLLSHDSTNRDEVLARHIASKDATILLTPSMTEGIDLKDDLSRFQVICKIPYPYLGDKLCRKRMSKWSWWYPMQTAKSIVQMAGRSVRNSNDQAITYILDSDWFRFYDSNGSLFPETFRESLV